jgi:DNA-binding CsgD family transcriptional regulator
MVSASAPSRTTSSLPVTTQLLTRSPLLQAAIEELMDGILIITAQGEVVESNQQARQICHTLNLEQGVASTPNALHRLPEQLWSPCQQVITAEQFLPGQSVVPEFEILTAATQLLRVRFRWLDAALYFRPSDLNCPYLLVMLEQRSTSLSPIRQYRLSQREYQVWQLRTQGYSYQSIANQLYITTHTVKKHLKNVRIKQRSAIVQCRSVA